MNAEIFFIIVIIAGQGYFAWTTYQNIQVYKFLFPDASALSLERLVLRHADLVKVAPSAMLSNLNAYNQTALNEEDEGQTASVSLLSVNGPAPYFSDIGYAINTYLLRNSNSTADFNLLKDIAERHNDVVDDKISSTISVPLYLGLLGTLLGVVFGLFNISSLSTAGSEQTTSLLDQAIPTLLGGVKIAMIASFTGLLLTVVNSAFFLKAARSINASLRNSFYTFLQVELLPVINQSMEGTFRSLQSNLVQFNNDFSHSLGKLDGVMSQNTTAIADQAELIDMLRTMDLSTMAKANVTVLKQLEKTTGSLADFNQYLNRVNSIFNGTHQLTVKINEFLERTENLEKLAQKGTETTEFTQKLVLFLNSHFSKLEESKQVIADSVTDVNATIQRALDELKLLTEQKIASIRNIEVKEEKRIDEEYAERWDQLSYLRHLKGLSALPGSLATMHSEQMAFLKKLEGMLAKNDSQITNNAIENDGVAATEDHYEPNRFFRLLFTKRRRAEEDDVLDEQSEMAQLNGRKQATPADEETK